MPLYSACSQRIVGDGITSTLTLSVLENARDSGVVVKVRRLTVQNDATTVSTSINPNINTYRSDATYQFTTEGGAKASKGYFDSFTQASSAGVSFWYPVAPDYSGATPFWAELGIRQWGKQGPRLRSAAEQYIADDTNQLPVLVDTQDWILYPGQNLIVTVEPSAAANIPNTIGWICNCTWEETDITYHAISGTVTNGGSPVAGATIIILVGDDTSLTNLYFYATAGTDGSGNWTVNVPDGKLAFAYAQHYNAGTYYTSTGAPYIP